MVLPVPVPVVEVPVVEVPVPVPVVEVPVPVLPVCAAKPIDSASTDNVTHVVLIFKAPLFVRGGLLRAVNTATQLGFVPSLDGVGDKEDGVMVCQRSSYQLSAFS